MGTPLTVSESFVRLSSFIGCTKHRTTTFTDGNPEPSPRSIIQWFVLSKGDMSRAVLQVQPSLLQVHAPYTSNDDPSPAGREEKLGAASAFNERLTIGWSEVIVTDPWKFPTPNSGPRFCDPCAPGA